MNSLRADGFQFQFLKILHQYAAHATDEKVLQRKANEAAFN